jgi:DGQHR domain-containing protein
VKRKAPNISVRAVRTRQGDVDVFAFFLPGDAILKLADISRIRRNDSGALKGFQRKSIRKHVAAIVDYLEHGPRLFPNALTLAIAEDYIFKAARGREPRGMLASGVAGTLTLPLAETGPKRAWIVDGQQRSLALAQTRKSDLPVPVVAFVSSDMKTHREQFILVNRARPLSRRLIDELLPEIDDYLPRDLELRKLPSVLCNLLNDSPKSPFHGLIRRESEATKRGVVNQGAVIAMIKDRIEGQHGALSVHKRMGQDQVDAPAMYRTLAMFWAEVKNCFPKAWGLPPSQSRLMHSVGIQAMGHLMDMIMARAVAAPDVAAHVRKSLRRIATDCAWTQGEWPGIRRTWNQIEYTKSGVRLLADELLSLDYAATSRRVAA